MPQGVGKMTPEQIEQLTEWFESLATNDPDRVLPPPEFYAPTIAYLQMHSMDIISKRDTDMRPWNMSAPLVEYYADVWYAQRRGVLRAAKAERDKVLREAANQGSSHEDAPPQLPQGGYLFGSKPTSWADDD